MSDKYEIANIKIEIICEDGIRLSGLDNLKGFESDFDNPSVTLKIFKKDNEEIIQVRKFERISSEKDIEFLKDEEFIYMPIREFSKSPYVKFSKSNFKHLEFYQIEDEVDAGYLIRNVNLDLVMLEFDAFKLHSSYIKSGSRTILFSAPSGVGKSTQADLWAKYKAAEILNGDRTILRCIDEKWYAYGSPFSGSSGIEKQVKNPNPIVVVLRQGRENKIKQINKFEALKYIISETYIQRWDRKVADKNLKLIEKFVMQCPIFMFECTKEKEAVIVLEQFLEDNNF